MNIIKILNININDLNYFQALGNTDIYLSFNKCVPGETNINIVKLCTTLLNIACIKIELPFSNISIKSINNKEALIAIKDKFENQNNRNIEKLQYLRKSTIQFKQDKGYSDDDAANVGNDVYGVFTLTALEIIHLHKILDYFCKDYANCQGNINLPIDILNFSLNKDKYYITIDYIKRYLESILGKSIISEY